jgi:hypothetical protein
MKLVQVNTTDRRQVHQFLDLPFRIYRECPQWVPPLESDVRLMLDRRRHPFYRHSDAAFFLAVDDGCVLGRIAVLDNRNYNAFNHEQTAFFYLFESVDHPEAAHALFDVAFDWARSRGLNKIIGPKGFTALDGWGCWSRALSTARLGLPYNLPYTALVRRPV